MKQRLHMIKTIPPIEAKLYRTIGPNVLSFLEDYNIMDYTLRVSGYCLASWLSRHRNRDDLMDASLYLENDIYDIVDGYVEELLSDFPYRLDNKQYQTLSSILCSNMIDTISAISTFWVGILLQAIATSVIPAVTNTEYFHVDIILIGENQSRLTIMDEEDLFDEEPH